MADVKITNNVDLSVSLGLQDGVPLAKANLTQLVATAKQFFDSLEGPVDKTGVKCISFGGSFASPDLLGADLPTLTVTPGINSSLTIATANQKLLYPDDGFSPQIPIGSDEAWLGFEVDLNLAIAGAAATGAFGASFAVSTKVTSCSWTRFSDQGSALPNLSTCLTQALNNFGLCVTAASLRAQKSGTVNTVEVSGSIRVGASVQQPFTINPLASVALPLNESAAVTPSVTLSLGASLQIAGDLLTRSYRVSPDVLRFGVYKKHGSALTAKLIAGGGVEGQIGSSDVVSALLNAALPGVDVKDAGITGENATQLNAVIKGSLDRSLSAQLNATCSAALTDEAAVLYDIHLSEGDATATDRALTTALRGDWTGLENLSNAKRLRNIVVETVEKKLSLTVNLFGFYSATSTTDYLEKSTVLTDESGQISFTDRLEMSRINSAVSPYASDSNKLRQALIEDFLCTASYAAAGGKRQLNLTAVQSYTDYNQNMSRATMRQNVCLAYALGLAPVGSFDEEILANPFFKHAYIQATVHYDSNALESIFYTNPASQTPWDREEIERAGREAMELFLDPKDPTDAIRLSALKNDSIWALMDENGNTATFSSIPGLGSFGATQVAAISADWTGIVWWAHALAKVGPAITSVRKTMDKTSASDANSDPSFLKARQNLASVLGQVIRKTDAAFVHGWGVAVIFSLGGRYGDAEMDLTWNSSTMHLPSTSGTSQH